MALKQITEAEHVDQLVDELAEYDIDKAAVTKSGRRYLEPLSFKDGANTDLAREHRHYLGKGHVSHISHPQATELMKRLSKEYGVKLRVRSPDTAIEAYPVDRDTDIGRTSWEHNSPILLKRADSLWYIGQPEMTINGGRFVYDINGSEIRSIKIVGGVERDDKSKISVVGGVNVSGSKTLFDAMRKAKALREHKVEFFGGEVIFSDFNYPNIASVRSNSRGAGELDAYANRPSGGRGDDRVVARPEIVKK